jgi:hypothetical protein
MEFPDLTDLEFHQYLLYGGILLAVLAIVAYFLFRGQAVKLPAIVVAVIASLAVGLGLGIVLMESSGYKWEPQEKEGSSGGPQQRAGPGGMMPRGMQRGGGMPRGGGFMRGPSSKMQLAGLISKLDQLANQQLTLSLTTEQKRIIDEQTQDLLTKKTIDEKDAKKRLDILVKAFKKNQATFEAAGYRWPGAPFNFQRMQEVSNPFKEPGNKKHLESLRERVKKDNPDVQ